MNSQPQSLWADSWRRIRRDKFALVALGVVFLYILLAALAGLGLIAKGFDVVDNSLSHLGPSAEHWFGTDIFGRDVLGRGLHGIKTALSVGFIAASIAIPIGVTLGALAGYFGGKIDYFVVWLYTTLDSIPYILLLIALSFVLGPGITNMYIAIGMTMWVTLCRLIRGEFMKHKDRDYVQAARALGAGHKRIMFRHILPNVFHIILIQFSLQFVSAIKMEVILSYLGLGAEAGTPSWGLMIDTAKQELSRGVWWGLACATVLMFGLILSLNLFNDALRESLDPKLKNK